MTKQKNKNKSAKKVSKETVQPEGTALSDTEATAKDETVEDVQKVVSEQRKRLAAKQSDLESYHGELQDRADELNKKEATLKEHADSLKDWAKELADKAKKGKGKASKEDATYAKKLSGCFLNGTVEEYIRTSAEQFEGETRNNFLNTIIDGAEAVKANT